MTAREVRRFVDDLLRGRRTKPFHAAEADLAELRTAITLRTARVGGDAPGEEFLSGLHRRLAAELGDPRPTGNVTPATGGTRRRFIQGASVAAAAAAIGAVGEHVLADSPGADTRTDNPQADVTLSPTLGAWRTVAASDDLLDGGVRAFDLGSVTGFVHRGNGRLRAVSGTCTHQGCRLQLDAAARRLDCPCHDTVFALTGELLRHQLPVAPRPLPRLAVREVHGAIQVYAPPAG
ncbi:MAG: 2Fe-2S ferredoxin [Pseudonocardiales bacterium]|nr:MAG: 2Fe-2S ferredoxin [Pseudonocardiales bacterium]